MHICCQQTVEREGGWGWGVGYGDGIWEKLSYCRLEKQVPCRTGLSSWRKGVWQWRAGGCRWPCTGQPGMVGSILRNQILLPSALSPPSLPPPTLSPSLLPFSLPLSLSAGVGQGEGVMGTYVLKEK